MTGYWPRSFFACLWTSTSSRSINTQKKNLANIQSSWPHAWSITHTYPFSFKHKYFSVLILWTSFRCVAMQRLDNHVPSLQLSVPSSLTTVTAHAVVVWITTEVRLRDIKTYSATVNIIALFQLCQSAAWCWAWLVIAVLVVKRFVSWAAGFGCLPFMIKAHHWSYLASTSARPWALQKDAEKKVVLVIRE